MTLIKRSSLNLFVGVAAISSCVGVFLVQGTEAGRATATGRGFGYSFTPLQIPSQCVINSVAVGADGDIFLWKNPLTDPLSSVDANFLSGLMLLRRVQGKYKTAGIAGPNSLRPFSFSLDGSVLFRGGMGTSLYRYSNQDGTLKEAGTLPLFFKGKEVFYDGRSDLKKLESFQATEPRKMYIRNMFALFSEKLHHIGIGRDYAIYLDGEAVGVSALNVRNIKPYVNETGKFGITFDRVVSDNGHSERRSPIVERKYSRLSGSFSERDIEGLSGNAPAGFQGANRYVVDVSAFDEIHASISYDLNGVGIVNMWGGNFALEKPIPVCTGAVRSIPKIVQPIALSDENSAFLYEYSIGGRKLSDKKAVIFFHGGPASTIRDNPYPEVVRNLLNRDTDIFYVDYLGSALTGSRYGLSGTAPAKRMTQSHRDLALGFRDKLAPYGKIVIISESFGAVPANIIRKQNILPVSDYIYIAPLLKLRSPGEWLEDVRGTEMQGLFENSAFGGSPAAREEMGILVEDISQYRGSNDRMTYIFGENDAVSREDDLVLANAPSDKLVVKTASHKTISGFQEVWILIKNVLVKK